MHPTNAIIDLAHLQYNYRNIRKKIENRKVMAVLKADAYGHGVEAVVRSLLSSGTPPEYLGVAYTEEGIQIRRLHVNLPIVIFDYLSDYNIDDVFKFDFIPTVSSLENIRLIERFTDGRRLKIHIKVDTGMGRLGIPYEEAFDFIEAASRNDLLSIDGIYTHFAEADETDKTFTLQQNEKFRLLLNRLHDNGISYGLAHAANSGAVLDLPETYYDMVRPGILLYGNYPSLTTSESIRLHPVLSLVSRVSSVRRFPKGVSISYGRKYFTEKETTIISVPIGYADGVPVRLSNSLFAVIDEKKYPQVGRITMDRMMLDVGDDVVKTGDKVILIGSSGATAISVWDWAVPLQTIPYEVTCAISKRIPRIFKV